MRLLAYDSIRNISRIESDSILNAFISKRLDHSWLALQDK